MAYDTRPPEEPPEYPRILYWSNPRITHPTLGVPLGIEDEADNARTLNNTRNIVANWRASVIGNDVWVRWPTPESEIVVPPEGKTIELRGGTWMRRSLVEISDNGGTTWQEANSVGDTTWNWSWAVPLEASGRVEFLLRANKGVEIPYHLNIVRANALVVGTVTGVITDTFGITTTFPLTNASVYGGGLGTTTNSNGHYSLWVPEGPQIITASKAEHINNQAVMFFGRQEITAIVGSATVLDFFLHGVPAKQVFLPTLFVYH